MIARGTFAAQHFENVDSLPHFACAGSSCCDAEKIRKADQFRAGSFCRQHRWPADQQRNATGGLKEVLFLPAMMIAEKIAVVGKKADENVVRIWACFDRIEYSAEAIVQIRNLAIVTGLYDSRQLRGNGFSPDGVTHEGNLFVQVILFDVAEDRPGHSIRIVHPVERNRRSQRRMRPNKRYEPKERARIIRLCDFLDGAISGPPFAA